MMEYDESSSVVSQLECDGAQPEYGRDNIDDIKELRRTTKSETRNIRACRVFIVLLMIGAGALVAWGTHEYLDNQLSEETVDKYHLFVRRIEEISARHVRKLFDSIESFSWIITAQANAKDFSFPFVTVEDFEPYGDQARKEGKIETITFVPWLKTQKHIESFPSYAAQNYEPSLRESIKQHRELNPHARDANFSIIPMHPFVYSTNSSKEPPSEGVPSTGPDPVLPVWMQSPPSHEAGGRAMRNVYPFFKPLIDAVTITKVMQFGPMNIEIAVTVDLIMGRKAHVDYHTMLHGDKTTGNIKTSDQPHGILYAPVFNHLNPTKDVEIGGFLAGFFGFDAFLVDILPSGIRGINVVIQNTCNDSYTYMLDGNEATYIGPGDLSDPKYANLEREISFDHHLYTKSILEERTGGTCSYMFYVTPTSLYMQDNKSKIPVIATLGVACIFALMVVAFVIYDINVQKRNNKITTAAARSHAVVSSMFPSTVRGRLLAVSHNECNELKHEDNGSLGLPTQTSLIRYLVDAASTSLQGFEDDGTGDFLLASKPLADLFLETTIMFADICGFKEWSYSREPSHVFTLLETVFRAFDVIAKKRRVFKVETVGDCYVAVCGLPDPCKDHAVVMARFARDCMKRTEELLMKLEGVLGPGTCDLCMRVGLHSGPVTAGVLRSTRSTFQLFGDTMNTASRMQSTGEGSRIQVSDDTAKHLLSAGKQHWLTPREQLVVAKGKGLMSTYWLQTSGHLSSSAGCSGTDPLGAAHSCNVLSDHST